MAEEPRRRHSPPSPLRLGRCPRRREYELCGDRFSGRLREQCLWLAFWGGFHLPYISVLFGLAPSHASKGHAWLVRTREGPFPPSLGGGGM